MPMFSNAAGSPDNPPAEGVRLQWDDLPAAVRGAVEEKLRSAVVVAETRPTGFSPGFAGKLTSENGASIFVKAVSPVLNSDTPVMHRREAKIVQALPPGAPVPRLLWTVDEGEQGWIVLAFQYVEGRHPVAPWRLDELSRVLEGLGTLASSLTPSPIGRHVIGTASEAVSQDLRGWGWLRDTPTAGLDDWSAEHLDYLAALEANAPSAVAGDTLLHLDIRADNLLLAAKRVWFLDWPHACVGAGWLDLVLFAPSVAMQGGPSPEVLVEQYPGLSEVPKASVTAAIATMAGFFTHRALQPPPPGLPTVRRFQAAQGHIARTWLAERLGWASD
jgi:hypothetical protein